MRRAAGTIALLFSIAAAAASAGEFPFGAAPEGAVKGLQPENIRSVVRAAVAKARDGGNAEDATSRVQSILNSGSSGGVVRLPAGVYRIDGSLTMKAGVRLAGAGCLETVLYRDASFKNKRGNMMTVRGEGGGKLTQITGISFLGVEDVSCRGTDYGVNVRGVLDFRVDHCYFERFGFASVNVSDVSRGVVDHCSFLHNFKKPVNNLGYGVVIYRGNKWEDELKLGTREATFVEDCIIVGCRHAVASNGGAHYVFRRNHVRGNVRGHAIDAHGLGYGSKRGTRCVEVYENLVEKPESGAGAGVAIRGGDGVVFRNVIKGYRSPVSLSLEGGAPAAERTGYPRKDQVRELYVWQNDPQRVTVSRSATDHIKKDRDYFEKPRPDYKPYVYPHPLAKAGPFDPKPQVASRETAKTSPGAADRPQADPEAERKLVETKKAAKLYRSARQAERSGLKDMAKTLYERLIKDYPNSGLAEKAKERLKKL